MWWVLATLATASAQDCRGVPYENFGASAVVTATTQTYLPALGAEVGFRVKNVTTSVAFDRQRTARNGSVNHTNALRIAGNLIPDAQPDDVSACMWSGFRADYAWVINAEGTGLSVKDRSYGIPVGVGGSFPIDDDGLFRGWIAGTMMPGFLMIYPYDRATNYGAVFRFRIRYGLQGGLTYRLGPAYGALNLVVPLRGSPALVVSLGATW